MKLKIGDTVRFKDSPTLLGWRNKVAKVTEVVPGSYRFLRVSEGIYGRLHENNVEAFVTKINVDLENK